MSSFFPFVIVGLVSGSIYGMTAVGLVLTYRTSGIFNFAHGAIAAASAFAFYQLRQEWHLPWPVAAVLCIGVFAPAVGVVLAQIGKGLSNATTASRIVATVGLLVAIQGLLLVMFGPFTRQFDPIFSEQIVSLGSVNVGIDQMISFALAVSITVGVTLFLARTRAGIAMRGVVDDPDLLDLVGDDPAKVRRAAWMMGTAVAAISGILIAPILGLDALMLVLLVVQAFGAAAIGRFTSIPRTFAGGLLVGVGAALSTKYIAQVQGLSGFPTSFPFIVLFVVLLFTRRGRLVELGTAPPRAATRRPVSRNVRVTLGAAFAVAVLLVPSFAGVQMTSYTHAVIFVLLFASLRLLVLTSGQVTLCHAAFAAVGAATMSHLTTGQGWPWLIALFAAGLVAVPVGVLLALPAIRLSGLYLGLATFGFGVLLQRLVFPTGLMFGGLGSVRVPRPVLGGLDFHGDTEFFFLCVGIVAAGIGAISVLTRTRLGRLLRALSDSPTALATLGNDVNQLRVLVFCISAFMASLAGALFASFIGSVGPNSFDPFLSLTLIVVLAISGRGELSAPVIAAAALILVPGYVHSNALNDWLPVLFGTSAIVAALVSTRQPTESRPGHARARSRTEASPVRWRMLQTRAAS